MNEWIHTLQQLVKVILKWKEFKLFSLTSLQSKAFILFWCQFLWPLVCYILPFYDYLMSTNKRAGSMNWVISSVLSDLLLFFLNCSFKNALHTHGLWSQGVYFFPEFLFWQGLVKEISWFGFSIHYLVSLIPQ